MRSVFWVPRLISTAILLPTVAFGARPGCINDCRWRIGLVAFALLVLDHVDSAFFNLQTELSEQQKEQKEQECNEPYQFADKVGDQVQYAVALFLLWAYCGFWSPVIIVAYILRWIGVALFAHDGSVGVKARRWLALFPDLTKELLLLVAVLGPGDASPLMITLTIAAKVAFEVARMVYSQTCD